LVELPYHLCHIRDAFGMLIRQIITFVGINLQFPSALLRTFSSLKLPFAKEKCVQVSISNIIQWLF